MNAQANRLAVHLLIGASMLTRLALPGLVAGMAGYAGSMEPEQPSCAAALHAAALQPPRNARQVGSPAPQESNPVTGSVGTCADSVRATE
jgi:hypothetical protein